MKDKIEEVIKGYLFNNSKATRLYYRSKYLNYIKGYLDEDKVLSIVNELGLGNYIDSINKLSTRLRLSLMHAVYNTYNVKGNNKPIQAIGPDKKQLLKLLSLKLNPNNYKDVPRNDIDCIIKSNILKKTLAFRK